MSSEFLRNAWYVAASSDEIGHTPFPRRLLDEPVVMYRTEAGRAAALEDRCCHRRAPLSKGKVIGDRLQCGYHGFTFDADGDCVGIPDQDHVPRLGVRAYPLVERHGFLWIWMGEADRADPASVPDFKENVAFGWRPTRGLMPIACHYQLVAENLLDLSHVGFVHGETIGTDDSQATLDCDRGLDFVRILCDATDVATPPGYLMQGFAPRSDQCKVITFRPPCQVQILVSTTERAPEKVAPRRCRVMVLNACTPETERSTHYFFVSARDFDDGPEITEKLRRNTWKTFSEDKAILEAQQRAIELDPTARTVNVSADWGNVQMRRLMATLIAEENEDEAAATQAAAQ
ncbi:MAG TPA: aromatic ring-hydroxylating dioxygenase subunit alpha [Stellaceae bacterium]|jgi:vanillate O-demethylase monooxygenase subunit